MSKVSRRSVLKIAGGASLGLGASGKVTAFFGDGSIIRQDHFVPADKKLSATWRRSLFARGTREAWSGEDLDAIGMPIGGIAAGQLYLCGDGTLGCWEIFNRHKFLSYGATNYAKRAIEKPVQSGIVVTVDGEDFALDRTGFNEVVFRGEHPLALVDYRDPRCPVEIRMTAYSPFVPLNEQDSALPATILEFDVKNTSDKSVKLHMTGSLQNAVGASGERSTGDRRRHCSKTSENGHSFLVFSADPAEDEFGDKVESPRAAVALANFEGEDYKGWTVQGEAFGSGPASGTLEDQNPVTGYEGKGLVNTFFKGDTTKGVLTSAPFQVQRRFINFKIGGGNHPGQTCANLLVGGKIVRSSTGLNDERLLWDAWNVAEFEGKEAQIVIVDNHSGAWGHINVDSIEMADELRSLEDIRLRRGDANSDTGSMALGLLHNQVRPSEEARPLSAEPWIESLASSSVELRPGQLYRATFVLAWHFPNHRNGRQYANWFKDAAEVVRYVAEEYERLRRETRLWRDTYYDSTLPYWLLDRLHSTNANLATGTTEWWGNGRFWAWEGVVCCHGTCTHVWNYEHGLARLFPSIQRNIRERQDFGEGFHPDTGLVGFRGGGEYAADGQCGTVLKAYREHLCSPDDGFLRENWPKIRKALEFLVGHDSNADGLIEDLQHNTYDINFFGANTFVGALYLAALRAGEEMAKEVGQTEFAEHCQTLFQRGVNATEERLWSGEYFVQEIDQDLHKEHQYGPGCLSDQLFGQGWAHQVGLGHIYDKSKVRRALESVWTYNWTPDIAAQNARWKPERPFAVPGEGGLFICTWPKGGRQTEPVRYRDEVWTGIEYQVAGHMVWEGMVEQGLAICRAIHDRYHPAKRNPYNEVECSDHYARALASWGVFTALSGFSYHGPKGAIGFAPKMPGERFKSAFTASEGWGTYEQSSKKASLTLVYGRLRLTEVTVTLKGRPGAVTLDGKPTPCKVVQSGGRLVVTFDDPVVLSAGQVLSIASDADQQDP